MPHPFGCVVLNVKHKYYDRGIVNNVLFKIDCLFFGCIAFKHVFTFGFNVDDNIIINKIINVFREYINTAPNVK